MVEAKRLASAQAEAPSAKRPSGQGSGGLEEDLDAELDAQQQQQQDQMGEDDFDTMMLDDDIELHLGEAGRNWTRPEPALVDPQKDALGQDISFEQRCCKQRRSCMAPHG